jgi:small neutral amino acid transporter SnatA (MarC family)
MESISVVPMAIPIVAGPGAITTVIDATTSCRRSMTGCWYQVFA